MYRVRLLTFVTLLHVAAALVADPVDDLETLVQAGDFVGLLSAYSAMSSGEDFGEIEAAMIELAKERVVASDYETAREILDVVLKVNLFNVGAQELYVSVNSLLRGRIPGSDAPAVARVPGEQAPRPTGRDLTASPGDSGPAVASAPVGITGVAANDAAAASSSAPAGAAPEVSQAVVADEGKAATPPPAQDASDATATAGAPRESAAPTGSETALPEAESTPEAGAIAAEPKEADAAGESVVPDAVAPFAPGPSVANAVSVLPLSFEVFVGPVSLMGNASRFYRDFYGESRFGMSYGISGLSTLLFHLPRMTIGPELRADGYFLALATGGDNQFVYKLSANVGFPGFIQGLLFFRLGFMQQWYFFGSDIPDLLITSFPSPTLGAKLAGLRVGERLRVDGTIDLYTIPLFTSYMSFGFDAVASVGFEIPLREGLTLLPRLAVRPQVLVAFGRVEVATKVELGIGVISHEP